MYVHTYIYTYIYAYIRQNKKHKMAPYVPYCTVSTQCHSITNTTSTTTITTVHETSTHQAILTTKPLVSDKQKQLLISPLTNYCSAISRLVNFTVSWRKVSILSILLFLNIHLLHIRYTNLHLYQFPALYTSFTSASTVLNLRCYGSKMSRAKKHGGC